MLEIKFICSFRNEVRFKYILNIGLEIIIQYITKNFKSRYIII